MKNDKRNSFQTTTEIIGGIQLFLSPVLIGVVISGIFYMAFPATITLIMSIAIVLVCIFWGVKLARSKYKSKDGTIGFLSKVSETPDLESTTDNKLKK